MVTAHKKSHYKTTQLRNHLYRVSRAYGLQCQPHLDNHGDMHHTEGGKTQLFSLQDDGVQEEESVERRGGETLITHHGDESSVCHGSRYK